MVTLYLVVDRFPSLVIMIGMRFHLNMDRDWKGWLKVSECQYLIVVFWSINIPGFVLFFLLVLCKICTIVCSPISWKETQLAL